MGSNGNMPFTHVFSGMGHSGGEEGGGGGERGGGMVESREKS